MSKKNLLVLGAGGHAGVVCEIAEQTGRYGRIACVDKSFPEKKVMPRGIPIIGKIEDAESLLSTQFDEFVVAIGDNATRMMYLGDLVSKGFYAAPPLIDEDAKIEPDVHIGYGTVICGGARVNVNANIGMVCIVNTNAVIEHDVFLGIASQVASGAVVAGGAKLFTGAFVGINGAVGPNVIIEKNAVVGGVTLVRKNLKEGCASYWPKDLTYMNRII